MVPTMANSSPGPVVGVDLGGTSVKAALVSADLELLAHDAAPTDISDEEVLLDRDRAARAADRRRLGRRRRGLRAAVADRSAQRTGRRLDQRAHHRRSVRRRDDRAPRPAGEGRQRRQRGLPRRGPDRGGQGPRQRDHADARDRCRRRDRARRAALPRFDRLRRRARAHGDRRERPAVPGPLPEPRLPREPGFGRRRSRGGRPDRGGAAGRNARNGSRGADDRSRPAS